MDGNLHYVTGLDVGTENVRAVIGEVNADGSISVVGYSEGKENGMRKGVPANLAGPAEAIDRMIESAERMSGQVVANAFVSVNGSQIISTKTEGMVIVGGADHEINDDDMKRVVDASIMGQLPANQEILMTVPLEYRLDGQSGIKDPYGMTGSRLEVNAAVVSALAPNCENLRKITEGAKINADKLIPSAVAAAKAVLTERQMENGVAVIDFGAATTSIAIFEEGDLQYTAVVPLGSNNITNDLAIILQVSTEIAEEIKTRFVTGKFDTEKSATIKINRDGERTFERKAVEEVVKDRLADIFGNVRKHLKSSHYDQRLPEGVVLTGGGARMRNIEQFVKEVLETAVIIGVPYGLNGAFEDVKKPEFATAVGLMKMAAADTGRQVENKKSTKKKAAKKPAVNFGFVKKFFSKF